MKGGKNVSKFIIKDILTIYGKIGLLQDNGHTITEWEIYIDNVLIHTSYNDVVNLVSYDYGVTGNDGNPYDGTNGILSARVRVKIHKMWSNWKVLLCNTNLTVLTDVIDFPINTIETNRSVTFTSADIRLTVNHEDTFSNIERGMTIKKTIK